MQQAHCNPETRRNPVSGWAPAFTFGQYVKLVCIGIAYWFAAAVTVKLGGPMGWFGPLANLLQFVAAFPVAWAGVWLAVKLAGLRADQVVPAIVVGTCAATACDGLGLTWARWLYGSDDSVIVFGAAWILWGVCAFFCAAIFEAWRLDRH